MEFLSTKEANRRIWGDLRHSFWRQRPRVWSLVVLVGLLLVLVWSTACRPEPAAALTLPSDATTTFVAVVYVTSIDHPPPEYARWYAAMETCLGMRGRYDRVRWFTTPLPWSDGLHGGLPTYGMWRPGHRILLNAPEARDSTLVSHEAIHDILGVNGIDQEPDGHPPAYFGEGKCSYRWHP